MKLVNFVSRDKTAAQRLVPMGTGGYRLEASDQYELQRQLEALGDPGQLAVRAQAAAHVAAITRGQAELVELYGANRWLLPPARPRWRLWAAGLAVGVSLVVSATVSGYVASRVAHSPALSPTTPTTPPAPNEPPPQGRVGSRQQLQHKAVASRLP